MKNEVFIITKTFCEKASTSETILSVPFRLDKHDTYWKLHCLFIFIIVIALENKSRSVLNVFVMDEQHESVTHMRYNARSDTKITFFKHCQQKVFTYLA